MDYQRALKNAIIDGNFKKVQELVNNRKVIINHPSYSYLETAYVSENLQIFEFLYDNWCEVPDTGYLTLIEYFVAKYYFEEEILTFLIQRGEEFDEKYLGNHELGCNELQLLVDSRNVLV